jgi:D-amino-acid dehydrogenase
MVLGAGMVGTGTALALQARGFSVVLLDRAAPGSETSYGNAGIIQGEACEPYALPRDLRTLCRMAVKADNSVDWDVRGLWRSAPSLVSYWRHSAPAKHRQLGSCYAGLARRATHDHAGWIAASGSEGLIRRDGYRVVFRNNASFDLEVRKAERMRSAYGIAFDEEDRAALAAAEPALRGPLVGAIRWRDAWTCSDPAELVRAYSRSFTKLGGELLKSEILGLRQSGTGWKLHASTETIEAAQVVVALGPWSPQLLAPLGYKVAMVPKRGYHLQFEYPKANAASRLNLPVLDAAFGAVYVPIRSGLRIATGADLSAERQRQPRQLRRAEAAARELLDIGEPIESSLWAGVRPCMPDMMPVVGAAPLHPGLWFNFGHGHQGFTLGPTTGELLAETMAKDSAHPIPLLAPARLFH